MEKLKVKHDHKLTDLIKVGIFAIFLIFPLLIFLPTGCYYAFNKYATAPTSQKEQIENKAIDFNQKVNTLLYDNATGELTYNNGNYTYTYDYTYTGYTYGQSVFTDIVYNWQYGHKYYIKVNTSDEFVFRTLTANLFVNFSSNVNDYIYNCEYNEDSRLYFGQYQAVGGDTFSFKFLQMFDLTQMFGQGEEPTIEEFNTYFPNDYYEYTNSEKIMLQIPTGNNDTYINITKVMQYAWEDTWNTPLFNWTGINNFQFTINTFAYVFKIAPNSYITNYINYLITMTAIYIIFDIIITLFTKLTHLVNEK